MPEAPHEVYQLVMAFHVAVAGEKEVVGSGEDLVKSSSTFVHSPLHVAGFDGYHIKTSLLPVL